MISTVMKLSEIVTQVFRLKARDRRLSLSVSIMNSILILKIIIILKPILGLRVRRIHYFKGSGGYSGVNSLPGKEEGILNGTPHSLPNHWCKKKSPSTILLSWTLDSRSRACRKMIEKSIACYSVSPRIIMDGSESTSHTWGWQTSRGSLKA